MQDEINNNSFCVLPFIHIVSFANKARPCCRFRFKQGNVNNLNKYTKKKRNVKDVFYCSELNQIRKRMISGQLIKRCYRCYKEERVGVVSMRQRANQKYRHLLPNNYQPHLQMLEIGFSNYCNLRCRSCCSSISSAWHEDDRKIFQKYNRGFVLGRLKKNNVSFTNNDLKNLKYIKFIGGEPMLSSDFEIFLFRLAKAGINKECYLKLFTNVSFFPKTKILEALSSFKEVSVYLSIDGYKDKNNYIRSFSCWSIVEKNTMRWLKLSQKNPNILINIITTASIYNVIYLEELLNWWLKKNKTGNIKNKISFNILYQPDYLSVINLSAEMKKQILNIIKPLKAKYVQQEEITEELIKVERILSIGGDDKLSKFLSFTRDLDRIRQESFSDTFPELKSIISRHLKK